MSTIFWYLEVEESISEERHFRHWSKENNCFCMELVVWDLQTANYGFRASLCLSGLYARPRRKSRSNHFTITQTDWGHKN